MALLLSLLQSQAKWAPQSHPPQSQGLRTHCPCSQECRTSPLSLSLHTDSMEGRPKEPCGPLETC